MQHLTRWMPSLDWMRRYDRKSLGGDLSAGLTTAVMLIPQGMAYAMLAGLPPVVGLYASIVPLALYALFGTSRQLAVGPVAMVSLLVASGVGALAEPGSAAFVAYAVLLAAMVGALQLVMGLGRLGFLSNFLSHPVVSGFTSAAALIIGLSQLKHLLGLDIARSHHVHEILGGAFAQLGAIDPITLALGAGSVAALVALKRFAPRLPAALLVVAAATLVVWGLDLHAAGVAIVGSVPPGLPAPTLPGFDWAAVKQLLPIALTIALVGFMESISVARAFARKHRYEVDANQELVALGLANLGGSLFGAYPVTGGFSRTAVNDQAGARTPLASLITAAAIALTLMLLTPLFTFLPKAVLAAIIMTAVFGLIDLHEVKHLWKVKRSDLALLLVTFGATLTLGIEEGILVGVGASALYFMVRTTRPHSAVLGRLPGTEIYRNVDRHPEAQPVDGLAIMRMDAQCYFGNVAFLKDRLKTLAAGEDAAEVGGLVIDASSINQLDSSADAAFHQLAAELREQGVELWFAGVKGPVHDVMARSGFEALLGDDHFLLGLHEAVERASRELDARV